MNVPEIKFLGIRFLRSALKSQHSLELVLQNRQEIDLLILEQGGTWAILNETCYFWVNTSSQVRESHSPQEKHSGPTGSQRMSWRVLGGDYSLFGGSFFLARGNLKLANGSPNPHDHHMIASCIINYLTHFVSAQVNKLQHAELVQQGYIKPPDHGKSLILRWTQL